MPEQPQNPQRHDQPGTITSERLFEGKKEIIILHEGQKYRLMITRAGKLILNK